MAASSWREPTPTLELKAEHCKQCRRMLGRGDGKGRFEVKCPRCGYLNVLPRK